MDNRVWVKDAVMTIRLPEEVDHFVADRLREETGEILVERNVREVVFDFRKTVFMDSSGIGMILFPLKRSKRSHATVPKLPEIINCPVLLSAPDAMTSTILIELS